MHPSLVPRSPLTQVVFVHDYIQLVFDDETFSLYNSVAVIFRGSERHQGADGFSDALVSLLGKSVISAFATEHLSLSIRFSDGTRVDLRRSQTGRSPEAFSFMGRDGVCVVEQNV